MPSVYFNVGHAIFAPDTIGIPSTPDPIAVLNGGDTALTISSIQIGGPNAGDFSLIGGSACFTQAISPGPAVKCSFEVGFTPRRPDPKTLSLRFLTMRRAARRFSNWWQPGKRHSLGFPHRLWISATSRKIPRARH